PGGPRAAPPVRLVRQRPPDARPEHRVRGRTRPDQARPHGAAHDRAWHDRARHDRARHERAVRDRARQKRARRDRARRERAGRGRAERRGGEAVNETGRPQAPQRRGGGVIPPGHGGEARIVVVGNGMAGSRFVTELRSRDPRVPVTVFGAEPQRPYNRVMLSDVLAGTARPDHIGLVDAAWYASHGVDARLGVEVTRIDRAAKTVHASDGTVTRYGTLVLATGSTAFVPPIPGLRDGPPEGALAFRTLEDCRRISALAESARRAVVVGGVLARTLARLGISVRLHAQVTA